MLSAAFRAVIFLEHSILSLGSLLKLVEFLIKYITFMYITILRLNEKSTKGWFFTFMTWVKVYLFVV
ncbi:hypothetical protein VL06_21230 [Rossellomorea marisflavi]|nr:hypothetical protein VL06_21230 [Rossellomorea marisflavi]